MSMTPLNPPRQAAEPTPTADDVTPSKAIAYVGWVIAYLTFGIPLAVILWRIATMPWG